MKATVSTEWLSGCSGCHVALVDLHEKLFGLLDDMEIVRSPVLVDQKTYPKANVGIVEGAVRSEHDLEALHKIRGSVDVLVAYGTCAVYGGPSGVGWLYRKDDVFDAVYERGPTNAGGERPDSGVPSLEESVRPIDEYVPVDLYLPGCPPHPFFVAAGLHNLLDSSKPGLTHRSVCADCNRKMQKRAGVQLVPAAVVGDDPDLCFLSQGIICLGSVSLNRCLAPCPKIGVACTGCAGPSLDVLTDPNRDTRTELAERMEKLCGIPRKDTVSYLEMNANTFFAYAMASPTIYKKPTVEIREWAGPSQAATS
ncbi:MAG: methyl viologen-reducing hydrogenase [Candidatus Eisenbacteria bacterium]|jgi:F420-non-reducing hydrogenase small subunit|nr:methyl viologen-reducing hydrogenase [Candidatus Eisenbacteria bacterium]